MRYIKTINEFINEIIKVDIKVGDTILGGRFKNKKVKVKKIGKNDKGDPTINDKPLLKFRTIKESKSFDDLEESIDYYLSHLEDDKFQVQTSGSQLIDKKIKNNFIVRIFKPKDSSIEGSLMYAKSNVLGFQWSEISGDIDRFISKISNEYDIDYLYYTRNSSMNGGLTIKRRQLSVDEIHDRSKDFGEMTSFTIGLTKETNNIDESLISIYDDKWKSLLPESISIVKDGETIDFKKGNIMTNSDMLQITYFSNGEFGKPDTLEFDIYFSKNGSIKLSIDITYGDLVVSEFSVHDNKVDVIEYTSYGSKFDPSNTQFGLDDTSLKSFINFINRFGFNLGLDDFKFLNKYNDYSPE